MKAYIFQTKHFKLEAGSKTPQLNKSSLDALLTPGGRSMKPGVANLYPITPLIDAFAKNGRPHQTIFQTQASRSKQLMQDSVLMTPMTKVLHADQEEVSNPVTMAWSSQTEKAKMFAANPAH